MEEGFLKTTNVKKSFTVGTTQIDVLKGINIEVGKGEFGIIFGPSGCGKSTLLHCLLGLEKPTDGTISIQGKDLYSMGDDERALFRRSNVGVIYQQPLWVSSLNVIENIMFPLHLLDYDEAKTLEIAMKILEKVGLTQWANYHPTELSSGQQQKISLARSMMTNPSLIVADEPTGNLDTVSGQDLLDTFITLVKEGKSIIMVTHDLEYLKYGTVIFHMIDGLVVEKYKPKSGVEMFAGKKSLGDANGVPNVHDPELLSKLNL